MTDDPKLNKLIKECEYRLTGHGENYAICRLHVKPCLKAMADGVCDVCIEYFRRGGKE